MDKKWKISGRKTRALSYLNVQFLSGINLHWHQVPIYCYVEVDVSGVGALFDREDFDSMEYLR